MSVSAPAGNAVIGQAGGPTAVINQSLVGAVLEAAQHPQITGFYGALHGVQGVLNEDLIDLRAESREALELVAGTPSAALGSVRKRPSPEECQKIFEIFQAHGVRYFFYIGGNDSAETAEIINRLGQKAGYELRVCHIPKTIDNDLLVTDHCPGYGSAARFVAMALMGDDLDNRALAGVKIDVVMGRNAGFLTAAASLGRSRPDDGPHLVYVPEVVFKVEGFCADVDAAMRRWKRCVVAVSEGVADEKGQPVFQSGEVDSHGNVQLSGSGALGDFLAGVVKKRLSISRVRADTLGYLQRSFPGVVSSIDAEEARRVGTAAVRAVTVEGHQSGSIAIRRAGDGRKYSSETFVAPLESVAKKTRRLDPRFIAPSGNDITAEFAAYALPLVGELPRLGRLSGRPVAKKVSRG
jgi:6-phosphofructokinase